MISLKSIKENLLVSLTEPEIIKCLKEISESFTKNRDQIESMYEREEIISSYACFYLPTNMKKMEFLVSKLSEDTINNIKDSVVYEIGTGPGTYLLALHELLEDNSIRYLGVDTSKLMLKQAKAIQEGVYPDMNVFWHEHIPIINDRKKTFIFGNSLNEMGHHEGMSLIKKHSPDNIILIEPGTKSSFDEISKFRNLLIKEGYNSQYPCPSNGACPLQNSEDWCHQVIKTSLDYDVERLSQLIKLDRKTMPAVIHFYTKNEVVHTRSAVVTRLFKNLKHAFIWEVCLEEDGFNITKRVEVPKKQFSKKEVKSYEKMSSGFRIEFEVEKEIDEKNLRIKLK